MQSMLCLLVLEVQQTNKEYTDMKHPNHTEAVQADILNNGTREQVIAWLQWNDANGVYTDEASEAEGLEPLTLDDARNYMREQLEA